MVAVWIAPISSSEGIAGKGSRPAELLWQMVSALVHVSLSGLVAIRK